MYEKRSFKEKAQLLEEKTALAKLFKKSAAFANISLKPQL